MMIKLTLRLLLTTIRIKRVIIAIRKDTATKLKAPLYLKAKGSKIRLPPKVEAKARESPLNLNKKDLTGAITVNLNKKDLTGAITVKPHLTQRTIAVPSLIQNPLLPKVNVKGRTLNL